MNHFTSNFLHALFEITCEMAPFLLLGFFFAGFLHAYVPPQKIKRHLGQSPLKSSFHALLLGIPLPLCSCGVIPTGLALYKNGASKSSATSFLIATPQTGIDSILASYSLMGLPMAFIRPLSALITGLFGGLINYAIEGNTAKETEIKPLESNKEQVKPKWYAMFQFGFLHLLQDISSWLIIGLLIAALTATLVPNDFLSVLNLSPLSQMMLTLVISIPLYVCATGSIPLAAVLMLKGLSPGAAFVLLMAGPASNAATITMVANALGKKSLVAYLSSITLGALACGIIIDYWLPSHWFDMVNYHSLGEMHTHAIRWWEILSAAVLTMLIINGYYRKFTKPKCCS